MDTSTRFYTKVLQAEGCWLWKGSINAKGYARFWDGARLWQAHRWSYEHTIGPIPEGLQLDHLCRVRNCVNPAHLEPVTNRENTLRGLGPAKSRERMRRMHGCPSGHPYDEHNTIVRIRVQTGLPRRECRACQQARDRVRGKLRTRKKTI